MGLYAFLDSLFPGRFAFKSVVLLWFGLAAGVVSGLVAGGGIVPLAIALGTAGVLTTCLVLWLHVPLSRLGSTLESWRKTGRIRPLPDRFGDDLGRIMIHTNVLLARAQRTLDRAWSEDDCDPITGALEKSAVVRHLKDAGAGWLIGFEIAGFEAFRAAHGPSISDEFLVHVVHTCTEAVRQDDMVARIEDHRFLVFLPGAGQEISERLVTRISQELGMNNGVVRRDGLAASFGIAAFEGGSDVDAAFGRLGHAIGQAQAMGPGAVAMRPQSAA